MTATSASSLALWQHGVALALVAVDILSRAGRSVALLPVSTSRAIVVNCAGDAIAAITPARAGGDPVRYVWFTRTGTPGPLVLASFATENAVNTVFLVALAIVLLVVSGSALWRSAIHLRLTPVLREHGVIVVGAIIICSIAAWVAAAFLRRAPSFRRAASTFVRDTWRAFRGQPGTAVAWASLFTALSMLARMAILPVLVARVHGLSARAIVLAGAGSLYGLLLAPTPGGVGAIEGGFFAGFRGVLTAGQVTALLLAWRAYAWFASAAIGAVALAWRRWLSQSIRQS